MKQQTKQRPTPSMKYAGFGVSFVAYLIDAVIYFTIAYFIWGSSVAIASGGSLNGSLNNEQLLILLANFLIFWLVFSSTPGNMLLWFENRKSRWKQNQHQRNTTTLSCLYFSFHQSPVYSWKPEEASFAQFGCRDFCGEKIN